MSTATEAFTPDELLRMGSAGKGYELVNGELKELEVSTETSRLAAEFVFHLRAYLGGNELGWLGCPDAGFQCFADDPGRVRKPDVAYTSFETVPRSRYRADGFSKTAPDLVVEIVSPNDLADDVDEKRDEWLNAGVKVVWVANPRTRTVMVFRTDTRPDLLRGPDSLTIDLLPGFTARVGDIFRRPDDPAPPPVQ